jgi:hypothetical protein
MLTVFLSIDSTISLNLLTPGEKFNSGAFCEKIFELLSEILHGGRAAGSPRPIVHFDTTHRSAATENCFQFCQFRHALQPPYIPDISPCDSFLFGDLKRRFKGEEFDIKEELQARVEELLGQLTPETWQRVYEQ